MRLAVVGTGLIGASAALAAWRSGTAEAVAGWDEDPEVLDLAVERDAVAPAASIADALANADVALVAVPVAELPSVVRSVLDAAPADCTVTDVGSTKGPVTQAVTDVRFIGGHPVCGSHTHGAAHANAELFRGATWFLTPVAATDPQRYRLLHGFVASLGAVPVAVDPQAHVFAS